MKSLVLIAAAVVTTLNVQASELWFHLRVEEHRGKEVKVEVNLPFSAIERSIGLLPSRVARETSIRVDGGRISVEDLREAWRVVNASPRGTWVQVDGTHKDVEMRRDGEDITMRIDDDWEDEVVDIRMPADVFHALISGPSGRFDFSRAVQMLGRRGKGNILITDGDDKIVRIWVDSQVDGEIALKVKR